MDDKLMTRAEVAARLRISVRQFDRLPIPRVVLGRSVRVRPIDLDEFVEARIKRPVGAPEPRSKKFVPAKKSDADWLAKKLAALKRRQAS